MNKVKIESKINTLNNRISLYTLFPSYELFFIYDFDNFKYSLFIIWLMIFVFSYIFDIFYNGIIKYGKFH